MRVIILADSLRRSEGKFEGVERGCELVRLLENSTVSKVLLMLPILQEVASGGFFSGRYGFFVIKY